VIDESAGELRDVRMDELSGERLDNGVRLAETGAEVGRGAEELVALLVRVERAIVMADRALRLAQPPIAGKIGIRWWVMHGKDAMRMPVLVTWHRAKNGRWRARKLTRVRSDRITRDGTAGLCADHAYEIARQAYRLIQEYGALRKELEWVLRKITRANEAYVRVGRIESLIIGEHRQVVAKLEGAGYAMDERTRELPVSYLVG
jgi:hypothetical protein